MMLLRLIYISVLKLSCSCSIASTQPDAHIPRIAMWTVTTATGRLVQEAFLGVFHVYGFLRNALPIEHIMKDTVLDASLQLAAPAPACWPPLKLKLRGSLMLPE